MESPLKYAMVKNGLFDFVRIFLLSGAIYLQGSQADAAITTYIWSGNSRSSNWSDAANWQDGGPTGNVESGTNECIYLGLTTASTSPTVDTTNPWYAQSINFVANSLNVSLIGNELTLNGATAINGGVAGTFTHSITNNLSFAASNIVQIYSGSTSDGNLNIIGKITTLNLGSSGYILFRGSGGNSIFSGVISSSAGVPVFVTKSGNGIWTFSNTSNLISKFLVGQGITKLGADDGLGFNSSGKGPAVVLGNTALTGTPILELDGNNQHISSLTVLPGNHTANAVAVKNSSNTRSTLTYFNDGNETYSGGIQGNISFIKNGNGTFTLAGTGLNTYKGPTTINAGTLNLSSTSALISTGLVVVSGGTLSSLVATTTLGGSLTLSSGSITPGGIGKTNIGIIAMAAGNKFTMSGGMLNVTLGSSCDQVNGTGNGSFAITGGTLNLDVAGDGFSYSSTYSILNGYSSGSVTGLTLSGYDTTHYQAKLSESGVVSFTAIH